jgi:hypothetical protein
MQVALTISVGSAQQDQRNVGLCAAEPIGYFGLTHRTAQHSDLGSLLRGQEFLEASYASNVDGMLFVQPIINPFKVGGTEVSFHAVEMVDERKVIRVGNEGERNKAMDVYRLPFSVSIQNDLWVSNSVDASPDHVTKASSHAAQCMVVGANTIDTSHSSEIADFIKTFEVGDCSPFFINHHLMGPCERSAHSIVVSRTTQGGPACLFH